MTSTATTKVLPLLVHDTVRDTTDSGHTVALTVWRTHVSIVTFSGATTPAEWAAGCAEASRIRDLFNTHGGPGGIERHRNQLAIQRAQAADRHHAARTAQTRKYFADAINTIDTEMAGLEDLTTRAKRPELVETVTTFLSNAA
jgi:hypothetical protein